MRESGDSWAMKLARNGRLIIPFGVGLLVGAFGSVGMGVASNTGVGLSIYLSSATAAVVTSIGLLSAWALAARTDAIKCRRSANLARLRIRALRKEWELIHDLLGKVGQNLWSTEQVKRAMNIMKIMTKTAENRPDFEGILDNETDIKHANLTLDIFEFTLRKFSPPQTPAFYPQSFVEKTFRGDFDTVMVGMQIDSLRAAEAHFETKGS